MLAKTTSPPVKKGKATALSGRVADILMGLRQNLGSSQRDFADHIGVSFQQYQKYEKGRDRISLERAIVLCQKLGVSLDVFMNASDFAPSGFAETEQESFAHAPSKLPAYGPDEQEILDLFRSVPKKSRKNFLETVRQIAKISAGKN